MFLAAAVLVLLVSFWAREIYKKYQIQGEISALGRQISDLQTKNDELQGMISYFKTREYKERQARSLLNLQKPGEFAVALPNPDEPSHPDIGSGAANAAPAPKATNYKLWWEYFFGK